MTRPLAAVRQWMPDQAVCAAVLELAGADDDLVTGLKQGAAFRHNAQVAPYHKGDDAVLRQS